jgi:glycosyltransferase involved in cell wall biosynthesis
MTDAGGADETRQISVIIAARDEERHIGACLEALLQQQDVPGSVQVLVAANACTDRTVEVARSLAGRFAARGWRLVVLDLETPGKLNALNSAEATLGRCIRVYLDSDVRLDPPMLGQLHAALAVPAPRYATGTLQVARARTWITRQYGRFWIELPFVKGGAVGAGLFAVNQPGRDRWDSFPDIISDDTFARLQFAPEERIEVPARYHWPMVEGFANLVKVRRRQDEGVRQVYDSFPALRENEAKAAPEMSQMARLALRRPIAFAVYAAVRYSVRLRSSGTQWTRGR